MPRKNFGEKAVINFKIQKADYDAFKDKCDTLGVEMSSVLRSSVRFFISTGTIGGS